MTERIARLRDKVLRADHGRHRVALPAEWSTSHLPCSLPERKAHALCKVVAGMPISIDDDELIVGSRTVYASRLAAGEPIRDPSTDFSVHVFPPYLTDQERDELPDGEGSSKAHYVAGYGKLLRLGLGGIIEATDRRLEREQDPEKRGFLKAVRIAYESAANLALRYAELARELAQAAETDAVRRRELQRIQEVCEHVSASPPRDLHETLQLYWFAHLVLMVENQCLMSFGRFDQHVGAFFDACPPDEATELLDCFLIKLNDQADIRMGEGYYGSDNLMLAGRKRDGSDATNALTYACLDALERLRLVNPQMNVRLHRDSPARLWRRTCEIAGQGLGQLSIYNDDTAIPALASGGFPIEDARDWALDACQDVLIEGCSDMYVGGRVEMTPLLLKTLDSIDADATFEELLADYQARIRAAAQASADQYRATVGKKSASPLPFLSGSMDDCTGAARDITEGGLKYRDKGMFVMSPVNAVNSLAALKRVVYDDRSATLAAVKAACSSDFCGQEALRQRLLAAPKWGNDDDAVDALGAEILAFACAAIREHSVDDQARFLSGIHQPHHVMCGQRVGATLDGRKAGEAFPVTLSPANGTDRSGPTAVMRSVTKIDPLSCQWNHALLITLHPMAVRGTDGRAKLEALIRTYHELGGIQLQMNVIDADTLREAQRHPDRYRDLVVRVWGFSSYFVNLQPAYQEDVIRRTAHMM